MKDLLKKSTSMLNSNMKNILIFFALVYLTSTIASCFIPVAGIALSLGISYYIQQVFINFSKTGDFEGYKKLEPNFKGMLYSFLLTVLLSIPLFLILVFGGISFIDTIINIAVSNSDPSNVLDNLSTLFWLIVKSVIFLQTVAIGIQMILPFGVFVLLDDDFKDGKFFKSIGDSFKMASGYRLRFLIVNLLNMVLTGLCIFTLGLSLLYTTPLHYIMLSNLYTESKDAYLNN